MNYKSALLLVFALASAQVHRQPCVCRIPRVDDAVHQRRESTFVSGGTDLNSCIAKADEWFEPFKVLHTHIRCNVI